MLDSSQSSGERYLFKHGNGRQIKGLEEGVHTMQVGGSRRIVIPASMSYTVPGLGPYPPSWRARRRLNKVSCDILGAVSALPGSHSHELTNTCVRH
jgi:hypothetical protein